MQSAKLVEDERLRVLHLGVCDLDSLVVMLPDTTRPLGEPLLAMLSLAEFDCLGLKKEWFG